MTELQNTTATKVAFKDATPEEQQARIAKQQERYMEMGKQAGLTDVTVNHGYLRAAKIKDDTLVAKTGAKGKRYLFVLYDKDIPTTNPRAPHTLFLNVWTYAQGIIKRYDNIVNMKANDAEHKLTATIVHGKNNRGYEDLAAIFIDKNKVSQPAQSTQAPASEPRVAPAAPTAPETLDISDDSLPF